MLVESVQDNRESIWMFKYQVWVELTGWASKLSYCLLELSSSSSSYVHHHHYVPYSQGWQCLSEGGQVKGWGDTGLCVISPFVTKFAALFNIWASVLLLSHLSPWMLPLPKGMLLQFKKAHTFSHLGSHIFASKRSRELVDRFFFGAQVSLKHFLRQPWFLFMCCRSPQRSCLPRCLSIWRLSSEPCVWAIIAGPSLLMTWERNSAHNRTLSLFSLSDHLIWTTQTFVNQ